MQAESSSAPPVATPPLWRRVAPLVLAAVLIAFVLRRIDFRALEAALASTNYVAFVAFTAAFNFALLGADSVASTWLYRRLVCPIRLREFFIVRGASYLPALLNHNLGQGWLTYFVARNYGAPLWRVAGVTLLVYATTFAGVVVLGIVALPFAAHAVPWLAPVMAILVVAGLAYLVVIARAPAFLASRQALAPLFELGVRGHLVATAVRLPHVLVQFFGAFLPYYFFSVKIPAAIALVYAPVIMMVVTLPITPVGLGTRDALALQFFGAYAPGGAEQGAAAVVACSLSWFATLTLLQLAIGPLFLRAHGRLGASPGGSASS